MSYTEYNTALKFDLMDWHLLTYNQELDVCTDK